MGEQRFTLGRGEWYAVDFIADDVPNSMEGGYGYSPIYIIEINPRKSGERLFDLKFFHANYPQGVKQKKYFLETVHRGNIYLLARTKDRTPVRFLCIHELTKKWAIMHFDMDPEMSVQEWLRGIAPQEYL